MKERFGEVHTFCMFLGYPRSGHSLIGSLLDAHPNIVISHELNALQFVESDISRNELFNKIIEKSKKFTKGGRKWGMYSYEVKGQYQGKFTEINVIGDKKGGKTSQLLEESLGPLRKLRNIVDLKIKLIHVIRNPFDNITTMARGGSHVNEKITNEKVMHAISRYFLFVKTVNKIKKNLGKDIFDLNQEEFIKNPKDKLKEICNFLNVEVPISYLNDCANIVFKEPNKSRYCFNWNPELIKIVEEKASEYSFLKNYSFEE
jgi:hypothetical protein